MRTRFEEHVPRQVPYKGVLLTIVAVLAVGFLLGSIGAAQGAPQPINPLWAQKYIDDLAIPPAMPANPGAPSNYDIGIYQIRQIISNQPPWNTPDVNGVGTYVFAYGSETSPGTANYPGFTIEARRGVRNRVRYFNRLNGVVHPLPIDRTIMWADPLNEGPLFGVPYTGPIPTVTHLHGGEVRSDSDGFPMDWKLPGQMDVDTYPNGQESATLWYHDHAMGMTRLNVYMGLAGFYLLRDPANDLVGLPGPAPQQGDAPGTHYYEIPLAVQDRMFDTTGQLYYIPNGSSPLVHPFWIPEMFGDHMVVNGRIWPKLNVEPRRYRFRVLNGCNARFLSMRLLNDYNGMPGPPIWLIGTDGGFLNAPVRLCNPAQVDPKRLVLGPAERADIIIDFSGIAPGTQFVLDNNAPIPFPIGVNPDPGIDGEIMMFNVVAPDPLSPPDTSLQPRFLNLRPTLGPIPHLVNMAVHPQTLTSRRMALYEKLEPTGPIGVFVDGKSFAHPVSENPKNGSTEVWEFINLTMDTHPLHSHLIQFQLLGRQRFTFATYLKDYDKLNPVIPAPVTITPAPGPYLRQTLKRPGPEEAGWKDTTRMNPFEVTWIALRYTPQSGGTFPFDPTIGPGYVYHCHILDHEDNEMMRPFVVTP